MIKNFGIKILGTGSYKPNYIVKNTDFSNFIETDDEWITTRTGIRERRLNIGKSNFFMSAQAAQRALNNANVNADEIDMIIAATTTPDYFYPSLSCLVQNVIGAKNASAFDVGAACTGFVTALDIARNYLVSGSCRTILVVAGEMLSRQADFTDRSTCVLFGDGAGAIVVTSSDTEYAAILGANGEVFDNPLVSCKVKYENNCPFGEPVENSADTDVPSCTVGTVQMVGKEVYKFASDIMPKSVKAVCEKAGLSLSDIDLLIPHQANIRIINTAMRNLDIPMEKVYVNIENTGNISSACIPVCLDELYSAGRIKAGMKICMVAFGAGLTYGSIIMEV